VSTVRNTEQDGAVEEVVSEPFFALSCGFFPAPGGGMMR
jgi:hypothetical protein